MIKNDSTFTDKDLVRIFCKHLDLKEQQKVLRFFKQGAECDKDLDEDSICETLYDILDIWIDFFQAVIYLLERIRKSLEKLKQVLKLKFFEKRIDAILDILINW